MRELHLFDIVASELVSLDGLKERIAEEKEQRKAMAAWRLLTFGPKAKAPRAPAGLGPGSGKRKHAGPPKRKSRGAGSAPDDSGPEAGASGSSAAADSGEDIDLEPLASQPVSEAAPARPQAKVPQPRPATGQRQHHRRGQIWGCRPAFQLAPVHRGGAVEPIGWEAICGLHADPAKPALRCKKFVSANGLSAADCQLRLKRWLVAGLDTSGWPPSQRECHGSMGGVQLSQFADGVSAAQLDAAVSHAA